MEYFLAPQNIVFFIALGFGIVLVLGAVLGFVGHDVDHDVSHDVDGDHDTGHVHDHDHDQDNGRAQNPLVAAPTGEGNEHPLYLRLLSALGIGRVPITIVLMIMSLIFGGAGLIMNGVLEVILISPYLYGPASFVAASLVTLFLTGKCVRAINRVIPTTETHVVTKNDLVGRTGTLVLPASNVSGTAQIVDRYGSIHQITCRTNDGSSLSEGKEILVIDYNEGDDTYSVEAYNAAGESTTNA